MFGVKLVAHSKTYGSVVVKAEDGMFDVGPAALPIAVWSVELEVDDRMVGVLRVAQTTFVVLLKAVPPSFSKLFDVRPPVKQTTVVFVVIFEAEDGCVLSAIFDVLPGATSTVRLVEVEQEDVLF